MTTTKHFYISYKIKNNIEDDEKMTWGLTIPAANSGQAVLELIKLEKQEGAEVTEIVNIFEQ